MLSSPLPWSRQGRSTLIALWSGEVHGAVLGPGPVLILSVLYLCEIFWINGSLGGVQDGRRWKGRRKTLSVENWAWYAYEQNNLMHFSAIKWRSLLCSPRIPEHKYKVFSLFLLNKEDPFGVSDYIPVFLFAVLRSRSIVRFWKRQFNRIQDSLQRESRLSQYMWF